jgi:hypothetical protein
MPVSANVEYLVCTILRCAYCERRDVSTISTDVYLRTGINFCSEHEEVATRDFFAFYFLKDAVPLPHAFHHNPVVRDYVSRLSAPSTVSMTRSSGAVETNWRIARSHHQDLVPFFTKNPDNGAWSFMAENATGELRKAKLIDDLLVVDALNSFSAHLLAKLSVQAVERRAHAALAFNRARRA